MSSVLGNEWHISSSGNEFLTENGRITDKQQLYNLALNTDLKEICCPILHDLSSYPKVVLQIHKIRNISAPKANEDSQVAPRMLKITLTDGDNYIQAVELLTINSISLKNTPPGTKLLVENAKIQCGYLILTPQNSKLLGGKVVSLIEKWELTKSVQRNRRNNDEDGPPPWVNFGTKIQSGNQGDNFKSLANKGKDAAKENSEFEQQRQDAIAEASGAIKKVFGGRVKQNVQAQNNVNRRNPEKPREKKEVLRGGKGKMVKERGEIDDKPLKPSEKVSLFAFLEDKLPVNTKEDTVYQCQPIKNEFKDIESTYEDQNKFDYKRKKIPIRKQFEKPEFNNKRIENVVKKTNAHSKQNTTETSFHQSNNYNSVITEQKQSTSSANSYNKPKQSNYSSGSANFSTNNQYTNQKHNRIPHQNNIQSFPQNYQTNAFQYNQPPVHIPNPTGNNYQNHQPPVHNSNFTPNNYQPNQNMSNFDKRPYQKQNVQNNINHISSEVQKMSLNSQFASRSLRQHLNLGTPPPRRNEESFTKVDDNGPRWNIGEEVLAKYWEDGKYYNAMIISVTDKTFAVRFKGYGNIEEILKTDCLPIAQNHNRPNNQNQQEFDRNKQYAGSVEYRSTRRFK